MLNKPFKQAVVIQADKPDSTRTLDRLALFNEQGEPFEFPSGGGGSSIFTQVSYESPNDEGSALYWPPKPHIHPDWSTVFDDGVSPKTEMFQNVLSPFKILVVDRTDADYVTYKVIDTTGKILEDAYYPPIKDIAVVGYGAANMEANGILVLSDGTMFEYKQSNELEQLPCRADMFEVTSITDGCTVSIEPAPNEYNADRFRITWSIPGGSYGTINLFTGSLFGAVPVYPGITQEKTTFFDLLVDYEYDTPQDYSKLPLAQQANVRFETNLYQVSTTMQAGIGHPLLSFGTPDSHNYELNEYDNGRISNQVNSFRYVNTQDWDSYTFNIAISSYSADTDYEGSVVINSARLSVSNPAPFTGPNLKPRLDGLTGGGTNMGLSISDNEDGTATLIPDMASGTTGWLDADTVTISWESLDGAGLHDYDTPIRWNPNWTTVPSETGDTLIVPNGAEDPPMFYRYILTATNTNGVRKEFARSIAVFPA